MVKRKITSYYLFFAIVTAFQIIFLIAGNDNLLVACVGCLYFVTFIGWCVEVSRFTSYYKKYYQDEYEAFLNSGSFKTSLFNQLNFSPEGDIKIKNLQMRLKNYFKYIAFVMFIPPCIIITVTIIHQ